MMWGPLVASCMGPLNKHLGEWLKWLKGTGQTVLPN